MIYVTGDIHGDQALWDTCVAPVLKSGDTIIVAGDFGIGFFDGRENPEEMYFDHLAKQDYTILFCDGNHENFEKLAHYEISEYCGGKAQFLRHNIIRLMRGEVYDIEGKTMFVMGGGYSVDRHLRTSGKSWWPEEMPGDDDYRNASDNLERAGFEVDYILTHTAPEDTVEYMLRRGFIVDAAFEEMPLTGYLQWVADRTDYGRWYFGHFHTDAELWKNQYALLEDIRDLHTGELIGS